VQRLANLCVALLRAALTCWPKAHIRFSYFEKLIASSSPDAAINEGPYSSAHLNSAVSQRGQHSSHYSPAVLSTCLDIMLATLDSGPCPNAFIIDNILKAQQLIIPCFSIPDKGIHDKVNKLLYLIATLFSAESGDLLVFYQQLNFSLDNLLRRTVYHQYYRARLLSYGDHMSSETKSSQHGLRNGVNECMPDASSVLLSVLTTLEIIGQHSGYTTNHSYTVLHLAFMLANQHLMLPHKSAREAASLRASGPHSPLTSNAVPLTATPVMAVLAQSMLTVFESRHAKLNLADETIIGLQRTVIMLFKAIHYRTLPKLRRPVVALLFACIERSRSVALILSIVQNIGILIVDSCSALTSKETVAFMESLSQMDQLPELESQPLFSQFLVLFRRADTIRQSFAPCTRSSCSHVINSNSVHLYAAGMISPHPSVRSEFVARFLKESGASTPDCFVTLLDVEWTPISSRFWLIVVVEALLTSIRQDTQLKVAPDTAVINCAQRLAAVSSQVHVNAGSDLQQLLRPYCASNACFLCPMQELAHAHILLAHTLLLSLLPCAVCNSVDEVSRLCAHQLSAQYHSGALLAPAILCNHSLEFLSQQFDPERVSSTLAKLWPLRSTQQGIVSGSALALRQLPLALGMPKYNVPSAILALPFSRRILSCLCPETILDIADNYGCHHAVLEVMQWRQDAISDTIPWIERSHRLPFALAKTLLSIFSKLREQDSYDCMLEAMLDSDRARVAVGMRGYGCVASAQCMLFHVLNDALNQRAFLGSCGSIHCARWENARQEPKKSLSLELACSEHLWVECARELSQWQLLNKMDARAWNVCSRASQLGPQDVALEASWKANEWGRFHSALANSSLRTWSAMSVQHLHMVRLAIVEGRFDELDLLCGRCVDSALQEWGRLPPSHVNRASHTRLLRVFHELVEIHESGQILHDAVEQSRLCKCPDLYPILQSWRRRLPNAWESIAAWEDVLRWREYCFCSIRRDFAAWCAPERIRLLHDSPWTTAMLARAARFHNIAASSDLLEGLSPESEVALQGQSNMEDAFTALREKILAYLCPTVYGEGIQPIQLRCGLQRIEGISATSMNSEQRAELLRLRSFFLVQLHEFKAAHHALLAATNECPTYGQAWLSWGILCDGQQAITNCRNDQSLSTPPLQDSTHLAKCALVSYIAALEHGCGDAIIGGVARLLRLTYFHADSYHFQEVLITKTKVLPAWIWIPWLHHLFMALSNAQAPMAVACIVQVALCYPQAVFYMLRRRVLEGHFIWHLDAAAALSCQTFSTSKRSSKMDTNSSGCDVPETTHDTLADVASLVDRLHSRHAALCCGLDLMCQELMRCMQSGKCEQLRHVLIVVLEKCFDSPDCLEKKSHDTVRRLMASAKDTVFSPLVQLDAFADQEIQEALLKKFTTDLLSHPTSKDQCSSMTEHSFSMSTVITLLTRWQKSLLAKTVNDSHGNTNVLSSKLLSILEMPETEGMHVQLNHILRPEIPGQYKSLSRPHPAEHATLLGIHSFAVTRQTREFQKELVLISSQGQSDRFVTQEAHDKLTHYDERVTELLTMVLSIMTNAVSVQKRQLQLHSRAFIPMSPSICLSDDPASLVSLHDVKDMTLDVFGRSANVPLLCAKRAVLNTTHYFRPALRHPSVGTALHRAQVTFHQRLCGSRHETADVVTMHVRAAVDSFAALWAFRKAFATQHAIHSIYSHLLRLSDDNPTNFELCCMCHRTLMRRHHSGLQFPPESSHQSPKCVSMRLTRNIAQLLQPPLTESVLIRTIGLAVLSLHSDIHAANGYFRPVLSLFLVDEMCARLLQQFIAVQAQACPHVESRKRDVRKSVDAALQRVVNELLHLSPTLNDKLRSCYEAPERCVQELVVAASSDPLLAKMKPTWQPWF